MLLIIDKWKLLNATDWVAQPMNFEVTIQSKLLLIMTQTMQILANNRSGCIWSHYYFQNHIESKGFGDIQHHFVRMTKFHFSTNKIFWIFKKTFTISLSWETCLTSNNFETLRWKVHIQYQLTFSKANHFWRTKLFSSDLNSFPLWWPHQYRSRFFTLKNVLWGVYTVQKWWLKI